MQNTSIQKIKDSPARPDSAVFVWLVQIVSGVLLILLLALHMIAHHFVVEGGLRTYADVIDYISNPIIFILEVLFLIVVVPHAILGLQNIIADLGPSPAAERRIAWILRIVTVITLAYGIWLAIVLQQ
jgi:succinate dehydrogenase / fumarate reductase membrane anchor subunit